MWPVTLCGVGCISSVPCPEVSWRRNCGIENVEREEKVLLCSEQSTWTPCYWAHLRCQGEQSAVGHESPSRLPHKGKDLNVWPLNICSCHRPVCGEVSRGLPHGVPRPGAGAEPGSCWGRTVGLAPACDSRVGGTWRVSVSLPPWGLVRVTSLPTFGGVFSDFSIGLLRPCVCVA